MVAADPFSAIEKNGMDSKEYLTEFMELKGKYLAFRPLNASVTEFGRIVRFNGNE
jgi:hypothetical protein